MAVRNLKKASVKASAEEESSRRYLRQRFDEMSKAETSRSIRHLDGVHRCVHPEPGHRTPVPTLLLVGSSRHLVFQSACRVRGSPLRCRVGKGNVERRAREETLTQPGHQPGREGWSMPTHASRDVVPSEGTATGDLTRRRFLTYVVAAPVLTVAASSGVDLIAPSKAHAVVPSPPQPENLADLGDVMVAATKLAQHLLVLEVTSDNRIVFRIPRAEVGQGITTAFAMVVADEIDAPPR